MAEPKPLEIDETKELSEDELRELIKKAVEEGREESRLIYIINQELRFGGCGYHYLYSFGKYKVLLGEVEEIELSSYKNENECYESRDIALIPKTSVVVVYVKNEDENPDYRACDNLLVFAYPTGWKKIEICDGNITLA